MVTVVETGVKMVMMTVILYPIIQTVALQAQ
jgi:hypothetical protein